MQGLSLTVGEVVSRVEHPSPYVPLQRCLLCEAGATVAMVSVDAQITCVACGQYCASPEAARALDALVKYREPALQEMQQLLGEYRQRSPDMMPRIRINFVVSDDVPTFWIMSG
jgi:hypothetical protein